MAKDAVEAQKQAERNLADHSITSAVAARGMGETRLFRCESQPLPERWVVVKDLRRSEKFCISSAPAAKPDGETITATPLSWEDLVKTCPNLKIKEVLGCVRAPASTKWTVTELI
jgi:hypothetical protein